MVDITAAMVKQLREKTDAPIMECKTVLIEAEGNLGKAEELLRVKLGSKASKVASRVTAEGLIGLYLSDDGKQGAVVEVNCETDFVAQNQAFITFVNTLAQEIAIQKPADLAAVSHLALAGGTVEATRTALVGKIGENISVRRFQHMATANKLASYVHGGKIGVLVEFTGSDQVGKDLAMHIAASKPQARDVTGVAPELIASERSIAQQKAAESGKPAEIIAKMVEGSVQKFLKEVSLLSQPFVKNDKQSIEAMLKAEAASVGNFALFIMGEGIEKKTSDFAAEVAAAVAG
jgi:elongation factor Ts